MSKIFRLHTGTTENIEHWQQLPGYIDHTSIDKIQDPSGLSAKTQITSVPTPFARMDLVKSAFLYVASNNKIDGTTIYHRMISDCLDIAEIFYNIEGFGNKIEILEWNSGIFDNGGVMDINPESDLGRLIHSSNPKHKLLGETLKMYLIQDKKHFNFSDLKHIYILNYKHGPEPLNIIGGTSPTTLFFSSANNLSYVDLGIANDKFFDGTFYPLHKRTPDFIKYVYTIQNVFPNFSEKFKGLNTYLDLTYPLLNESLKDAIKEIKKNSKEYYNSNYNSISVNSAGNLAEIMGFGLKAKKYDRKVNTSENDFIIEATKNIVGDIPCVLPIDAFNDELNYGGGKWQKDWYKNVPKIDNRPLLKRTLPNQEHIEYPYLTISDLLEPYIIKVPYPIDTTKFFNGNYQIKQGELDHGYILPIKKDLLNYFNLKDLQGVVSDGKKMLEIKQLAGGVSVVLRIPIQKNRYVEYNRTYINSVLQDRIQQADEENNQGVVIENQFTIAIYPFVKLDESINPHYRVLLVDRDINSLTKHFHYSLDFFKEQLPENALINITSKYRSDKNHNPKVTTNYFVIEQNYDFIEVKHNIGKGLIIPLFVKPDIPSKKFKFAIDFGTTNTHIEYKVSEIIKPFEISENDIQLGTLYLPNVQTENALSKQHLGIGADDLVFIIQEEFAPFKIGNKESYKFPQRTVINDNGMFNADEANFALADFNIPFWYLKEKRVINSTITPNLKWLEFKTDNKAERRTRAFLKQIMMMLRNKVILNGGDLKETEIVWFYPSSMPAHRKNRLEGAWTDFYKRYFGDYNKLYKLSESFAPFYYYFNNESVKPNTRPAANIDIGGGTSDIVIYSGRKPIILTSFRFASNAIFGDGYGSTNKDNGFVQKYESIINSILSNTSAKSLIDIYLNIKQQTKNSIELCKFFFSLQENKLIKDNNINLSFSNLLAKDDDLKIVFIFFYSSIIYHLAKLMKSKDLQIPEFITFSGNGAKLIQITNGSENLSILENLTITIFKKVFNTDEKFPIKLKMVNNPKEITCKGGLEINNYSELENIESEILNVLLGNKENNINPSSGIKYNQLSNKELIENVGNEVKDFINFFFELNNEFNFSKNFGINLAQKEEYKRILNENLLNDLISGIEEKLEEVKGNEQDNIEETLFFYPLKGCLNRLAYQIYLDTK